MMQVRRAQEKDIPQLEHMLGQVLNLHAEGRPDIFIPDTTKYSEDELKDMLGDEHRPVFVAADETDTAVGYAMCVIRKRNHSSNMTDITTLFVDDICVDASVRHRNTGRLIYDAVKEYARSIGAYHITLNVWTCNPGAIAFYEKLGLVPMEYVMEDIL